MSKERERVGGLDEDVQALRAELEAAKRREAALLIQLASSQGACAALLKRCEQEVVARLSVEAECAALRRKAQGEGSEADTYALSAELMQRIYRTLQTYANPATYQAPRVGGGLTGCPHGERPTLDQLTMNARWLLREIDRDVLGRTPPEWYTPEGERNEFERAQRTLAALRAENEELRAQLEKAPTGRQLANWGARSSTGKT